MKIQPVHYVWENAPLKYYKFSCVLSVIGLMASLGVLISWREEEYRHWLDLTYNIVRSLVFAFSAWNLIKRRWSGAVAWCLSYLIWTIYAAAVCILYYINGISFYDLIPQIIVSVLAFFATCIYFFKRRPLFFPWNGDSAHSTIPSTNDSMSSTSWDVAPDEVDSLVAEMDEITRNAPKDTSSVPTSNGPEKPRFDFKKASDLLNHRPISSQETIYRCCPQCGQLIPCIQNRCDCGYKFSSFLPKQSIFPVISALLLFLLVISISINIHLQLSLTSAQSDLDSYSEQLSNTSDSLDSLRSELDSVSANYDEIYSSFLQMSPILSFYNDTSAIASDLDFMYHMFGCPFIPSYGSLHVFDIPYCDANGYSPCPSCFSNIKLTDSSGNYLVEDPPIDVSANYWKRVS